MISYKCLVVIFTIIYVHHVVGKTVEHIPRAKMSSQIFKNLNKFKIPPSPQNQTENLQNLRIYIEERAAEVTEQANEYLQNLENFVEGQLQSLRDEVEEAGGDLDYLNQCIVIAAPYFSFTYDATEEKSYGCINETLLQAVQLIDASLNKIMEEYNNFTNIGQRALLYCSLTPDVEECAKAIISLTVESVSFGAIDEVSNKAIAAVNTLTEDYNPCLRNVFPAGLQAAEAIVEFIENCYVGHS